VGEGVEGELDMEGEEVEIGGKNRNGEGEVMEVVVAEEEEVVEVVVVGVEGVVVVVGGVVAVTVGVGVGVGGLVTGETLMGGVKGPTLIGPTTTLLGCRVAHGERGHSH
jgi:hypothetical protein